MFLAKGARIGYWRGSIEGVAEDLQVWHCHFSFNCSISLSVVAFVPAAPCNATSLHRHPSAAHIPECFGIPGISSRENDNPYGQAHPTAI